MSAPAGPRRALAGRRSSATASPVSTPSSSNRATWTTGGVDPPWVSFKQMDLDAYAAAHRESGSGSTSSPGAAQLDRRRGRRTDRRATRRGIRPLATSRRPPVATVARRSALARARAGAAAVHRAPENPLRQIHRFFALQPARGPVPACAGCARRRRRDCRRRRPVRAGGSAATRALSRALGSDASSSSYAEEEFVDYYSENPAASFAGMVWTNNAWIAAQCVAFGIPASGCRRRACRTRRTWRHGGGHGRPTTGSTCSSSRSAARPARAHLVFVAAAAGLRIFWSWIAPGAARRAAGARRGGPGARSRSRSGSCSRSRLGRHRGLRHAASRGPGRQDRHRRASPSPGSSSTCGARRPRRRAGETGDLVEFEAGATRDRRGLTAAGCAARAGRRP